MNTRIKMLFTILLVCGISWLAYSGTEAKREQAKYAPLKAVITDAREMKIYGRDNNGFRAKKPLAVLSSGSHPQMFDMIKKQSSYDSRMVACSAELLITVTE